MADGERADRVPSRLAGLEILVGHVPTRAGLDPTVEPEHDSHRRTVP